MNIKYNHTILRIVVAGVFALGSSSCTREIGSAAFVKGPYLQNVQQHSITIMWETSQPTLDAVEYWSSNSVKQLVSDTDSTQIHEITLVDLMEESEYWYRIVTAAGKSRKYSFQTAVKETSPFTFAAYGDNKSGPFNHKRVADLILAKKPNLVMHNGDLVDRGGIDKQWDKLFFGPAERMMHSIPLFPVLGNHEDHADNYYNYFSLPGNEQWYSFDFGNAHFVVLDSDEDFLEQGDQIDWLINDLENNTSDWTFAFFHHPPFTSGGNYYRKDRIYRQNLLHPIFERYGIDVVFNGHDHNYERIKPVVSHDGSKPVTYIVCGNGGTPMRYTRKLNWTAYVERVFGIVLVAIDGQKMRLQAINTHDEIIDELVLDKSDRDAMETYYADAVIFDEIRDVYDVSVLSREADGLMDDEMYQEAVARAREAIALDQTCVEAWAIIANSAFELGDLEDARAAAEQAINILPTHPDAYEVLAEYYLAKANFPAALEYCEKLVVVEPDSPGGYELMSEVWLEQGDTVRAIETLQQALEILPSDSDIHFDLGKLYEESGSPELAFEAYQDGLDWFMDESEDDDAKAARRFVSEF
ncbi:MAG: metallophosphoesterase [Fidelibacterota bacterium]|nr:MAG: metallophosphoesterase [Candidatus Neomarinimicrobiota bacterium]